MSDVFPGQTTDTGACFDEAALHERLAVPPAPRNASRGAAVTFAGVAFGIVAVAAAVTQAVANHNSQHRL